MKSTIAFLKSSQGNFIRPPVQSDIYTAFGITRDQVAKLLCDNIPVFQNAFFPFVKQTLQLSAGFCSYLRDLCIIDTNILDSEELHNQYANNRAVQAACIHYSVSTYDREGRYDAVSAQLQVFKLLALIRNITLRIWVAGEDDILVSYVIDQENDALETSFQKKDGQVDLLLVDNTHFVRLEPAAAPKRKVDEAMASLSIQETPNKKSNVASDHLNSQGENSSSQSQKTHSSLKISYARYCSAAIALQNNLHDYRQNHSEEGTPENSIDMSAINTLDTSVIIFKAAGDDLRAEVAKHEELKNQQKELKFELENNGNTELHLAARAGDIDKLKELLTQYSNDPSKIAAELNRPNTYQYTPVMLAANNSHDKCVDFLLAAGSRISTEFYEFYGKQAEEAKEKAEAAAAKQPPQSSQEVVAPPKKVSIYKMFDRSSIEQVYHASKHGLLWKVKELVDFYSMDATSLNQKITDTNYVMVKDKLTEVIIEDTALYIACFYDHAEIVKFLLAHGADANIKAKNGWSCLFVAAKKGFTEIVRMLIAGGAYVHDKNKNEMTALNISAYGGHEEIVNMLLEKRVDPNVADIMGAAPLHAAVQSKKLNIVKLLVEYGADINQVTRTEISILYVAAYSGQFDIVEYLTDNRDQQGNLLHPLVGRDNPQQLREEQLKPVDINALNKEGLSALTVAALNGHLNIVERLLKLGADRYKSDKKCVNSLYAAAQNGHIDVARCLLNSGCTFEPIENKNTPFHAVAIENRTDILELLLEKFPNENIDAKNIDGITALYMACEKGHLKVLELLIAAGANVNTPNKHTVSPLNIASQNGHTKVVELLLANGADVNSQTEDGPTPLFIASQNGHTEICKLLLAYNAAVDTRTKEKETALFVAGYFGHVEIVEELIKHKAQLNLVDRDTRTPLWWACKAGKEPVVKLLMDAGADVNISDREHVTPMMIAAQHRRNGVCELLNAAKSQATLCSICLTNQRCTLFFPCKHLAACADCDEKMQRSYAQEQKCPTCQGPITERVRISI